MWPFAQLPDPPLAVQRQIGHAILIRNADLGIDWQGPARFIMQTAREAGMDLDHVANLLMTEISIAPLFAACSITAKDVAHDASPDARALAAAVDARDLRPVRDLLKREPHVGRLLPLDWCAWNGLNDAVAEILRGDRALVNSPSMAGMTPLHWAAANGHVDVVNTLLAAGANTGMRNDFLWTAQQIATANEHVGVAKLVADRHRRGHHPVSEVFELMGIRPRE